MRTKELMMIMRKTNDVGFLTYEYTLVSQNKHYLYNLGLAAKELLARQQREE